MHKQIYSYTHTYAYTSTHTFTHIFRTQMRTYRGLISSIFSLGYMIGLVPSGLLGTFSSPKNILGGGVLLWSVAQMATPFAAYAGMWCVSTLLPFLYPPLSSLIKPTTYMHTHTLTGIPTLLTSRFFMGLAEAVAIPTVQVNMSTPLCIV